MVKVVGFLIIFLFSCLYVSQVAPDPGFSGGDYGWFCAIMIGVGIIMYFKGK